MKTQIFHSRASLTATVLEHARWFSGLLAGTALISSNSVLAGTWNGSVSTDWNNNSNWAGGSGGVVQINSIPANVATISANLVTIPTSIIVGNAAPGQVNHVAGNASVSSSNDFVLGRTTGGNGTYNLANTAGTGGVLTGFGQGSGNLTIPDQVYVGGSLGVATGTLNIHTSGTLSVGTELLIGNLGGTGTVKMDSGTLTVPNAFEVGNGANSTGTFSMSGGTVTKTAAATAVTIGGGLTTDGGTGVANLNGGTFTTAGVFRVGHDTIATSASVSSGTLNLGGTALTVNGEFWVGNNTGATGLMDFTAGSITTNNWTLIGRKDDANTGTGASGTVTMSGGTWTKNGESNFVVGDTGPGTMSMSGGLVVVNPHTAPDRGITWIGNRNGATGALTISGNAEFRTPRMVLGVQADTTGTLNLNGGVLKTSGIYGGGGTSDVHFNGGKITPTDNSEDLISLLTSATLETGGLSVDTAGFNISITQDLVGAGGVTKTGTGTLFLKGSNTYTGNHTVSAGKLLVATNSNDIGTFTVANGAGMGVVQDWNGGRLSVSKITLGSAGAASLDIGLTESLSNPTASVLNVSTTLTLNGPITLNITDPQPTVGVIPLITYAAKTGTGSFVLGTLPLGVTATLTDNGTGLVSLNITQIKFPVWKGTIDAKWDTTTPNWRELTTLADMTYTDPAPVLFDDSATGLTALILNTTVSPGEVKFNNETTPYTLSGTGKISGPGGLTKMGASTLEISTVNEYTGVTTLAGGITTVNSITNGGVASPLGKASAAAGNLVLSGGVLNYTGATATSDRGFTNRELDSSISVPGGANLTMTGPVVAGSSGSFDKRGEGTLTLSNPSVTLADVGQTTEILAGTLELVGPGQTVSVPTDLFVGSVPNVAGHLSLQNSNLTVGGVLAVGRGNGDTGTVSTLTATNSVVQVLNFSTGFDNSLATNDSDQTITLNNTNWTTNGATLLAERQNSTTNMTLGGTSAYTAKANFQMAINATAVCNLTLQDTASVIGNAGWFSIGNDGIGTLTVKNSASLSTVGIDLNVSDVGASTGFLNLQDSGSVSATGTVYVGKNAGTTGTVNVSGGTFTSATWVTIGRRADATGFFNISGGTVNQTDAGAGFIVGENGKGTLTITGGTLNINGGGLYLSAEAASTSNSKAYLNGGTIIAKRVVQRDFNAANYTEFHFNGGILRAQTGASSDFMNSHDLVSVDAGGAFIDSNAQTIVISQVLTGSGSLTKQGTGTLSLTGTNTYAGNTSVNAGTLTLTKAYLSDSSSVTIATGSVLNLTHGLVDQVAGLTIGGTPLAAGTYDAVSHPGIITGSGKIQVTGTTASAYSTWISGFPSIPVADRDPGDDPDGDGSSNLTEFALGGTPNSGGDRPKVYHIEADGSVDVGTNKELLMTVAVRGSTPAFAGSPSPTAAKDGVTYTIQGSTDLAGFATGVTVVNVVPPLGNPNPPVGYEYRTFSLNGSDTLPNKGFVRVKVE